MTKDELINSASALLLDCQMLIIGDANDAEEANKLIDLEVKLRNGGEKLRKEEKEPYLKKCQEIDASYKPISEIFIKCQNTIKPKVNEWLKAEKLRKEEEARKLREEEERAREKAIALLEAENNGSNGASPIEVDAATHEANEAEKARMQAEQDLRKTQLTGGGARARSLKEVWSVEVIDPVALVNALANDERIQRLAIDIANGMAKAAKDKLNLAGVKPVMTETV